ncbi:ATP-binding protein [Alteromonas portus]|uniref:ATP-binding protein n=1 Tax=Alteromonas portus TaxID=2565549 RepID=UPI003BF78E47
MKERAAIARNRTDIINTKDVPSLKFEVGLSHRDSDQYLHHAHNIIVTSATGCGKTYLACVLARRACEQNHTVRCFRLGQLLDKMNIGHAYGSYQKKTCPTRQE